MCKANFENDVSKILTGDRLQFISNLFMQLSYVFHYVRLVLHA